jgi:hypothetical protein
VDQATLQQLVRNEERHFRETVDYIYTKPTAKLWGRKAFEETLRPAIQKAIEQGLLQMQKPEDWFGAVYSLLFGEEKRRGPATAVTEEVLDEYLPHEEPLINVPPWAEKLRIGHVEYCLSTPICHRAIITHTRDDSQYVLLAVRELITEEDENKNKREIPNYSPIALLPKYMGQVYDPFYGEWFFIAILDGKVIAASTDFDNFIEAVRNAPGGRFYVIRNEQYLDLIKAVLPRVRAVVSAGVTDDVFVDPYGVLDIADYGVDPLLKAYEWIGSTTLGLMPGGPGSTSWLSSLR